MSNPAAHDSYRGARVLVTGAGGFIGRWVARQLSQQGATLFLAVRDQQAASGVFARWGIAGSVVGTKGDNSFARIIADTKPDIVFNLAGYGVDPSERDAAAAEAINANLPAAIADSLAKQPSDWTGARLVHAGSALEYGTASGDLNESTVATPTTLYGRTKLAGTERLLAKRGVTSTIARLFTVYGPGEHEGRLLPSLLRAAESTETLPLTDGRQQRDFTYVEDVADGLLRLGRQASGGVVNLATGRLQPVRAFVETAAEILGIAKERLQFGALPSRPEEMHHDPVNIALLRQRTGWMPATGIAAGIEATRRFVRGHS